MEMSVSTENSLIATIMPEVCYPNVDPNNGLAPSPVSEFLADEEAASTCPLLTPSPPTEFEHPLSTTGMAYERQISPTSIDELTSLPTLNCNATLAFVNNIPTNEHNESHNSQETQQESSSSSSSVTQEPTACAQLLSSHHYQHLTKASDVVSFNCQENGGKPPLTGIQLAVRKSPDDFCFMEWNWTLIRKLSFWGSISLMVACVCIVITLIAGLPNKCNPVHAWWQGTVFYEVFPGSFMDDNLDGTGDFRGLGKQTPYFTSLGVKVVRLNSIFLAEHYPENFDHVQNLTEIAPVLGNMKDFNFAVNMLHKRNISVILDLPISPFLKEISRTSKETDEHEKNNWVAIMDLTTENASDSQMTMDQTGNRVKRKETENENMISTAIRYWLKNGIDGIYLKGLEYLVDEPNFSSLIREWKKITKSYSRDWDHEKILMCSMEVINALDLEDDSRKVNAVLSNMDLIDIKLDIMSNGTKGLKKQVDKAIKFVSTKPSSPWIHWHMGDIDTKRLTSQLPVANASLAAVMFEMMLPGTLSIFYGDEIGLEDFKDSDGERKDISHIHHLPPMHWSTNTPSVGFTQSHILPWLPFSAARSDVETGEQKIIHTISRLREESPSIYMNGIWKDNEYIPNYEIRTVEKDIVLVERSYPRRHSYVIVSNFGTQTQTKDLSFIYYGGEVIADQRGRTGQYLTFHSLTLYAGESIIIKLDK